MKSNLILELYKTQQSIEAFNGRVDELERKQQHYINHIGVECPKIKSRLNRLKTVFLPELEILYNNELSDIHRYGATRSGKYDLNIDHLFASACAYYDVLPFAVRSKCQKNEYVAIRQLVMSCENKLNNSSLSKSGDLFDKDHATVLHGIKAIRDRLFLKDKKSLKLQGFCEDYIIFENGIESNLLTILKKLL